MVKPFFLVVLLLLSAAQAQHRHRAVLLKLDGAGALVASEYRLMVEAQRSRRFTIVVQGGWLARNNYTNSRYERVQDEAENGRKLFRLSQGYSLWAYSALKPATFLPTLHYERLQGPTLRAGTRFYVFGEDEPRKLYAQATLNYGLLYSRYFDQNNELLYKAYYHKPGGQVCIGWQFLPGHTRSFSIDLLAGAEAWWLAPAQTYSSHYSWLVNPELQIHLGVQVGVALWRWRH